MWYSSICRLIWSSCSWGTFIIRLQNRMNSNLWPMLGLCITIKIAFATTRNMFSVCISSTNELLSSLKCLWATAAAFPLASLCEVMFFAHFPMHIIAAMSQQNCNFYAAMDSNQMPGSRTITVAMSHCPNCICKLICQLIQHWYQRCSNENRTMCPPPRRWQTLPLRCHMVLQGIQKNSARKWQR